MFGDNNELESEILLEPAYPGLAKAPFDLDPDRPSTTPTLPIAALVITAINYGDKCNKSRVHFQSWGHLAAAWAHLAAGSI